MNKFTCLFSPKKEKKKREKGEKRKRYQHFPHIHFQLSHQNGRQQAYHAKETCRRNRLFNAFTKGATLMPTLTSLIG